MEKGHLSVLSEPCGSRVTISSCHICAPGAPSVVVLAEAEGSKMCGHISATWLRLVGALDSDSFSEEFLLFLFLHWGEVYLQFCFQQLK